MLTDCVSFMHWFCFTYDCSTTVKISRIQNTLANVYIRSIFLIADAIDLVKEKKVSVELNWKTINRDTWYLLYLFESRTLNEIYAEIFSSLYFAKQIRMAKRDFNWFFFMSISYFVVWLTRKIPFLGRCISWCGCVCINYWWSIRVTTNMLIFLKIS